MVTNLSKFDDLNIIIATHNAHKADEFKAMLGDNFNVLTMKQVGITEEPVEDGKTIEENSDIKVNFLNERVSGNNILLADDTGLFVEALDGQPGVFSARFAGENCTFDDNNKKLLSLLENERNRKAKFSTSIALILPDGTHHNVRGDVLGKISEEYLGDEGFGYDPIFIEESTGKTYAQMSSKEKNEYSHRKKAFEKAISIIEDWLNND